MHDLESGAKSVTKISNHSLADLWVFREIGAHLTELGVDLLQLSQFPGQDLEFEPSAVLAHECVRTETDSNCAAGGGRVGHSAVFKICMRCVLVEGRDLADDGR